MWDTKTFHELNRRISSVFGVAFSVGTASMVVAGSQDSRQFILRLVIPFGALLLAFVYTQKQAAAGRDGGTRPLIHTSRRRARPATPR